MPAVAAIITHGNIPSTTGIVDEPNLLIESLTITPTRELKEYKGAASKAVEGIMLTNPTLDFQFGAIISEVAGLADEHPGTAVTELANFADTLHGFDPEDGILLYHEPSRALGQDDPDRISFRVTNYPFVLPAGSSA